MTAQITTTDKLIYDLTYERQVEHMKDTFVIIIERSKEKNVGAAWGARRRVCVYVVSDSQSACLARRGVLVPHAGQVGV